MLTRHLPTSAHWKCETPLNGKGPSLPTSMSSAPNAATAEVAMMTVSHRTPTMTLGSAEPTQSAPTIAPSPSPRPFLNHVAAAFMPGG